MFLADGFVLRCFMAPYDLLQGKSGNVAAALQSQGNQEEEDSRTSAQQFEITSAWSVGGNGRGRVSDPAPTAHHTTCREPR